MEYNINNEVIIYPTEKGWNRIRKNIVEAYKFSEYPTTIAEETILRNRTKDNGFKEQLWVLIEQHNNLFYMGTDCLVNMKIKIIKDKWN